MNSSSLGKDSPRMKESLNAFRDNKDIIVYPKFYYNTNTNIMIAKQICHIINNDLKGVFHLDQKI